ncbi:MAG TPA: type II toxin-antitoxin system VapC family toxin [Candidatus Acidoferrum sp.]|nr:type II toxin-antitoxin system VapC family toxin [Candidatus Acidoferrum sp.]
MIVYADTSFLFSLYAADANSSAAASVLRRLKPPLLITEFGEFEFTNALNWRIFRKQLRATAEQALLAALSKDVEEGIIRIAPLTAATFTRARQISRAQTRLLGTRSLDVLHVASALTLRATIFCTFDQQQASLASAVGLQLV